MPVQPVQTQALEIADFSGGKTDYYLNGVLNKFQDANNLLLQKHGTVGKLLTRPGSEIYNSDYYQIPAGAQRIGTLKYFENTLFYHSARKFYYVNSGWQTLQGPTGNDVFPSGVTVTTAVSLSTWNKHLFVTNSDFSRVQKIYHDGTAWRLRTAGMPTPTAPTVTAGGAGARTYLYRFLFKYTYTVGTVTYIDRGATVEVELTSSLEPSASAVAITNIQALANTTVDNYDTASANLKVEIYRTTDGGVDFFYVGQVSNGTTTFNDTVSDLALQDNESLYTSGGLPERNQPPLCKFVHVAGDKGYFAHTKSGTEVFTNRIYQSIPGDIDSVPEDFFVDVQDEIVGFSSVRGIPIVLCKSQVYRLDGFYDFAGRGFIEPIKISDTAGAVNDQSAVQTEEGLFWAGVDGFYFTDGYVVTRVSDDIDQTYQSIIASADRKRRIVGKYDEKKKRVWWAVQYEIDAVDNDAFFVMDLNWGVKKDMPFTTASGDDNIAPTAIEFVDNHLLRADRRGYTFVHRDTLYVDPKINTSTNPSTWDDAVIVYDYVSVATNFNTTFARKWVPRITVNCKNETNLSMQIVSINDDGRRYGDLKPIRFRGNMTWGEDDIYWGDANLVWNYQGIIDEQRRFPAQSLRCQYKQVQMTNAYVAIINSELLGTCSVNGSANTATLTNTSDFDWPSNAVDYYIAFADDGYSKEFKITARTSDVLTFQDADGLAPTITATEWVIRGKPKGEIMHLISYALHYAIFGMTSNMYRKSSTGEVGASDGDS